MAAAAPWLPREVAARLAERPHEAEHMKLTHLLSTAFAAGFLGREDGQRPSWFDRAQLAPLRSLTADQREQLGSVCHAVTAKVRQAVSSRPSGLPGRPDTSWQAGVLCARVLWRTVFAAAAERAQVAQRAAPVLFMAACGALRRAAQRLLRRVWLEVQEQFTSKQNKYRNMKSRPAWAVLEGLQYQVLRKECLLGLADPAAAPPASAGARPSAGLGDFLEEVLALRLMVDCLDASLQDAQDFLEHSAKHSYRLPNAVGDPVTVRLAELKEQSLGSFATPWTEDAELRQVAALAARAMGGLCGPSALAAAATYAGQLLQATWRGTEPLLAQYAQAGIARLSEAQGATRRIPPPQLEQEDEDRSGTAAFHVIAGTYAPASSDTKELVSALPRGVRGAIVKIQAVYKGYVFRLRHFARARAVANYCKAVNWPLMNPALEDEEPDDPKDKRKRKKAKQVVASKLDEEEELLAAAALSEPPAGHRAGGQPPPAAAAALGAAALSRAGSIAAAPGAAALARTGSFTAAQGSTARSSRAALSTDRRAWPLPSADHRACADLFSLYLYNMYRRRELMVMWQTLCGAYERGMGAFAELLSKNPALRPMLDSIAAQLKRGSVVGYGKAFIAKVKKGDDLMQGRIKPVDAELFKRRDAAKQRARDDAAILAGDSRPSQQLPSPSGTRSQLGASASAPALGPPRSQVEGPKKDRPSNKVDVTEEYLTNYLKEMDGDDSQFKDISASVIPLSTGTSPPRQAPQEFLLKEAQRSAPGSRGPSGDAGAGDDGRETPARKRPKLDVPFCVERARPIWLPIKAHRFAAYRAKVLQLLPQRVLQQYVDFEKQGEYAACIKLLESATPGSLNVLNPATLVNNKPLLVETVLQLIVGYSGLGLRNQQGALAVRLITQVLDSMSLSLRDLHPGHRTVLEAYLYDTALSVCYYMPEDVSMSDRAQSFFQQASERYARLGHMNRYCKCCLRAAAVLHLHGNRSEAEYYAQQALNRLSDAPMSSLLAVCYHNLSVHALAQQRVPDAVAHLRAYLALLKQLPKLGAVWLQQMDNTQFLVLKVQELWPQYQVQAGMREPMVEALRAAWGQGG